MEVFSNLKEAFWLRSSGSAQAKDFRKGATADCRCQKCFIMMYLCFSFFFAIAAYEPVNTIKCAWYMHRHRHAEAFLSVALNGAELFK